MAQVTLPLMSYHATGSIGKKLTFRARADGTFVTARHTPAHPHRNPNQDKGVRLFLWKNARARKWIPADTTADRPAPEVDS